MDFVKNGLMKMHNRMKFLTNFIKEHRTLSLTILVGALLAASGIYLAITRVQAVTPDWQWVEQIGSTDEDHTKAVAHDDAGNVYVAGEYEGTITIDTPTPTVLISTGDKDIYIAKFDPTGIPIWATSVGGGDNDFVNGIKVNSTGTSGEIYLTGQYTDIFTITNPSTDYSDITLTDFSSDGVAFVARLDFDDNAALDSDKLIWKWASSIESTGSSGVASGNALTLDSSPSGYVYVTGSFEGDFVTLNTQERQTGDLMINSSIVTATSSIGDRDVFIAKISKTNGTFPWLDIKTAGGLSLDEGLGIDIDSTDNNIYVSGVFTDRATFDPGGPNATALADLGPSLSSGAFVAKYDSVVGELVWTKVLGGDGLVNAARGIRVDSTDNNIYTAGIFNGTAQSTIYQAIAGGFQFALAVLDDGTAWSWGANFQNQLGDGTTIDRHTPVQVSGLTDVTAVSAGSAHGLALKNDNTVWAWGRNNEGQLGDGNSPTAASTPVQVSGLTDATAIAGGGQHSLALKSDGTVWAWGYNIEGQLGDGTNTDIDTPVQTSISTGVFSEFSISSGFNQGITTGPDGNLWFTKTGANKIARMTTAGVVTEFTVPTPVSEPFGITAGPDGNLWFT